MSDSYRTVTDADFDMSEISEKVQQDYIQGFLGMYTHEQLLVLHTQLTNADSWGPNMVYHSIWGW